jgi:hypothetical protein
MVHNRLTLGVSRARRGMRYARLLPMPRRLTKEEKVMRGTRLSRLAVLALATATIGSWVGGCSENKLSHVVLPPHGTQAAPGGDYSIAWTSVEASGSGRVVVPGQTDVTLGPDQVRELAHALLNVNSSGRHGWEVTPVTDANGGQWLAVDPHHHGAAKHLFAYDPETGRAEGSFFPATFPAPSAALNSVMKEFIVHSAGIQNPLDVTATKFEIAAEGYSLHWTPDAKELEPGDIAYPSLVASGLTIEGVFYVGETEGSFSATIDRLTGDARGQLVTECPECAAGPPAPGRRPIGTNP